MSTDTERRAARIYCLKCRRKALERLLSDPGDRRHGTVTGYRYGCRCDRCRAARVADQRKYRARKRREEMAAGDWEKGDRCAHQEHAYRLLKRGVPRRDVIDALCIERPKAESAVRMAIMRLEREVGVIDE